MKIFIDPQVFWWQRFGGISRYITELVRCLKTHKATEVHFPLLYHYNAYLQEYGICKTDKHYLYMDKVLNFKGAGILRRWVLNNKKYAIRSIQKNDFDLFVASFYDDYFLEHLDGRPFVVTIYDMIQELFPAYNRDFKSMAEKKRKLLEMAQGVVAISNKTKEDIMNLYPDLDSKKIEVIHLAHSMSRDRQLDKRLNHRKHLLFVGKRGHYKNWSFMVAALAPLLKARNLQLICAGAGDFNDSEKSELSNLEISEYVSQIDFEEDQLAELYANALAFIFPSTYEGFGIPVLEAMEMECPVLLSNIDVFQEVAGEAAVYFDPKDPSELREKVEKLLNDDGFRQQVIELGNERVKNFSWSRCAEENRKFYQRVIEENTIVTIS